MRHTIKLKRIEITPLWKREQKMLQIRRSTHLWSFKQITFDFHFSCLFRILLGKMSRTNWTVHVWKAMETKTHMYVCMYLYVCTLYGFCMYVYMHVCMYVFKYTMYACIFAQVESGESSTTRTHWCNNWCSSKLGKWRDLNSQLFHGAAVLPACRPVTTIPFIQLYRNNIGCHALIVFYSLGITYVT